MTARAPGHTPRSTVAACLATILGVPATDVPLAGEGEDPIDVAGLWLAARGQGFVPVAEPAAFGWAGPWLALVRPDWRDGEAYAVVRFGVPSGTVWDPAGVDGSPGAEIVAGWVVAPLQVSIWSRPPLGAVGEGTVEQLVLAGAAAAPTQVVDRALAVPGLGLEGDRYWAGGGTFASGRPGSALTLVGAEALEAVGEARGRPLGPDDHRRNVVTRGVELNALVGRRFTLGDVLCEGRRLCEPCAHLDRLAGGGVLRPMVHRGGLRADILTPGTIAVGDVVRAVR